MSKSLPVEIETSRSDLYSMQKDAYMAVIARYADYIGLSDERSQISDHVINLQEVLHRQDNN